MADEIVVLITAASSEEAGKIGTILVEEHLVACVNIVPAVRSLFFWENKTQDQLEVLLISKSRLPLMDKIVSRVKSLHSYSVPEVVALPIIAGSHDYLDWVRQSTLQE
jgi:periplasmic divalent cation tolerance protein